MTPEERAAALVSKHLTTGAPGFALERDVGFAIREAVEAERELCIADCMRTAKDSDDGAGGIAEWCAERIRARGRKR